MRKIDQLDIFSSTREGRAAVAPRSNLLEALRTQTLDRPFMVSLGMGVDSVAGTIALVKMGAIPDLIIFADTGAERPETYDYIGTLEAWLQRECGRSITVCKYTPPKAPYETLEGEVLTNGILPGIALGVASCSIKWKQNAIHDYVRGVPASGKRSAQPGWKPALDCWERGERVIKFIGYDAGAKDRRRGSREGDKHYEHFYALRVLGYDRVDCANEILSAGLAIPLKSSCFFCSANKPDELKFLHHHHPDLFRRAINIETNALPKLTASEGLWRKTRVSDGRPGNWRLWAEQQGLLRNDHSAPDGFELLPQSNPPLYYPDDEIGHLLARSNDRELQAA